MVRALGIESEESDDEPKSGADAQEAQSA
jgi:hypothetical protein